MNLLSLSDIAALAQVERSTVSVWRSRARAGAHPFPAAVIGSLGSERFAALEIAAWLALTGRGNNAAAADDAGSFGTPEEADAESFDALLALRGLQSGPLAETDDILDAARRADPGDSFAWSEVRALGAALPAVVHAVDAAVEAAWTAKEAFERARAARPSAAPRAALSTQARALVADIALVLAGGTASGVFVDPSGVGAALILAIAERAGESSDIEAVLASSGLVEHRDARRRLSAHGIAWRELRGEERRRGSGGAVLVAQVPDSTAAESSPAEVLAAVERVMDDMPSTQRGVVIASATALCDRVPPPVATLRREILRQERVRAVVRLPEGHLLAHPRQALAIWILGPSDAPTQPDEQWTLLADVGERPLDDAVRTEIVGDVFAMLGGRAGRLAHAFALGRPERTRTVIAAPRSLLERRPAGVRTVRVTLETAAAQAVQAESLIAAVDADSLATLAAEAVGPDEAIPFLEPATIGALRALRALRYRSGVRLRDEEIGTEGYVVIGVPELLGESARGARRVGILEFEAGHERAVRTSPGDVVFCTSPLAAVVDLEGGAVVAAPARALSIAAPTSGIISQLLAADIAARPPGSRRWQDWPVRRVAPDRVPALTEALSRIAEVRAETERRLRALDDLETLVSTGAVRGSIRHPLLPTRTETALDDVDGTAQKGS